jgi:hypothetical protein
VLIVGKDRRVGRVRATARRNQAIVATIAVKAAI